MQATRARRHAFDLRPADAKKRGTCAFLATAKGFGDGTVDHFSTKELDVGNCTAQVHLGPAFVTIDDALLVFGLAGYCERSTARDLKIAQIAARLHNARAFQAHKKKAYADAAQGFAKSFELDPTFAQAAFNLACAQSLLGKGDEAIAALSKAVELDASTFTQKAQKDKDLDPVRGDPRFAALVK